MAQRKNRIRIFKSDRAREWATDFMIGIGMFVLVAFFASTHTNSALPAPLAKTRAVLEQTAADTVNEDTQPVDAATVPSSPVRAGGQSLAGNNGPHKSMIMVFMALAFSTLLTLTIHFWRNLRRAYASPRRDWGKG